jgi:hypothetical protein
MLTRSASGELLNQSLSTNTSSDPSNVDPFISYVGLFSPIIQQEYHIYTPSPNVLVYDNRTGYFNATHLVQTLTVLTPDTTASTAITDDITAKDFSKLLHFKGFADVLELLERDLNSDQTIINKSLPNYDSKRGFVVACYNLKHDQFSGTYVHPSLLSFVMLYSNHNLMLDMSRFMMNLFCLQPTHQHLSIDNIIEQTHSFPPNPDNIYCDSISAYKHDLIQEQIAERLARKEAAKQKRLADKQKGIKRKKQSKKPKFTTDTVKPSAPEQTNSNTSIDDIDVDLLADSAIDSLIDLVETRQKEQDRSNELSSNTPHSGTKSRKHKHSSVIRKHKQPSISSIVQALIIIIPSVQNTPLQQIKFITCLMNNLPLYQKQVPRGWVIHSTFINLRNLPTDLARRFNHDYEDSIETDIQIDTNGEVILLIDSLESFDSNIATFLADWMII